MDKRVYDKAVDYLYKNMPTTTLGSMVAHVLPPVILWSMANHIILSVWAVVGVAINLIRYMLFLYYTKRRSTIQKPQHWGNYYALTALAIGLFDGVIVMILFSPDSFGIQSFLLVFVVGVPVTAIIMNAYWQMSAYALAIPILGLSALRIYSVGTTEYIGLAIILVIYMLVLLRFSKSLNKSVLETIVLQIENYDLYRKFQEQKELAEEANIAKSKFLAAASHDLRQPLHAMGLFTSLLEKKLDNEVQKHLFNNVIHSVDALRNLLDTLLDVSKLDAGVVEKKVEHFYFENILMHLVSELAPEAKEKNLSFDCVSTGVIVKSDSVLLELILRNLLSNAIRYTEQGGVTLKVTETDDDMVKISIIDTGTGIPKDKQQEIFQEFYQLGNPERDRTKGLGLGLAIVKRLANLLNHSVEIESDSGQGTIISVIVPLGDKNNIEEESTEHVIPANTSLTNVPIILIDDEVQIREGMKQFLEEWGCSVLVAASEEEAIHKLRQENCKPRVIITDYRLREEKTGIQAIRAIRDEIGMIVPALIITGDTAPERLREAQASGHALLHKPVLPAQILAFIRHVVLQEGESHLGSR